MVRLALPASPRGETCSSLRDKIRAEETSYQPKGIQAEAVEQPQVRSIKGILTGHYFPYLHSTAWPQRPARLLGAPVNGSYILLFPSHPRADLCAGVGPVALHHAPSKEAIPGCTASAAPEYTYSAAMLSRMQSKLDKITARATRSDGVLQAHKSCNRGERGHSPSSDKWQVPESMRIDGTYGLGQKLDERCSARASSSCSVGSLQYKRLPPERC